MAKERLDSYRAKATKLNKPGQHSIYVMASSVSIWETNGWTAVDDGSSETDSKDEAVSNEAEVRYTPANEEEND